MSNLINYKNVIDKIINIDIKQNNFDIQKINENNNTIILVKDDINFSDKVQKKDEVTKTNTKLLNGLFYLGKGLYQISKDANWNSISDDKLKKLIQLYFEEGGRNLFILLRNEDKFSLDANISVQVAIDFTFDNSYIENFISNVKARPFLIVRNEVETNNYDNNKVFVLECKGNEENLGHTAAYINKLSLFRAIRDYNYTKSSRVKTDIISEAVLGLSSRNWDKNIFIDIAGTSVMLGGKLKGGANLVNEVILELLKKELQLRMFKILLEKPTKSEITGKIDLSIRELMYELFRNNGIEEATYKLENYNYFYNGKEYEVITTDEKIENGFKLYIVNINERSETDKELKKMSPIILILSLQNQIQFINLEMEVL